jgi:hypothetical protein
MNSKNSGLALASPNKIQNINLNGLFELLPAASGPMNVTVTLHAADAGLFPPDLDFPYEHFLTTRETKILVDSPAEAPPIADQGQCAVLKTNSFPQKNVK